MSGSSSPPPDSGWSGTDAGSREGGARRAVVREDAIARLVHDLRNPLNTISMSAELVAAEIDGEASGELGESLAALERAVGELERGLEALETHVGRREEDVGARRE